MSDPKPTTKKATKKAGATAKKPVAADKVQKVSSLSINQLTKLIAAEVGKAIGGLAGGKAGVHVNSGPPGFVNGGGHANFDPRPHVNSGPPGFVNGGGHANFDPAARKSHVNSGPPGFVNGGGHANFDPRPHVNSGPPGFVNGGGHANFDPAARANFDPRTDLARVHVNSGPPGFVNGGGHANFDPRAIGTFTLVSLPDGSQTRIPASGPVDIVVRGFRIKR